MRPPLSKLLCNFLFYLLLASIQYALEGVGVDTQVHQLTSNYSKPFTADRIQWPIDRHVIK